MTQAQKYKSRDTHEMILRSKCKKAVAATATVKKTKEKKQITKKPQRQSWKVNQRNTFANTQYIVHHDTTAEGSIFLQSKRAAHIAVEMKAKLEIMITNPFDHPPAVSPHHHSPRHR